VFRKILIANRGEIALRIQRACRELGIRSVIAYSEADRDSLPVRLAEEKICIGPAPAEQSYLHIPHVVSAALIVGADALHPGYGFLAENAYLAEICDRCGINFIGPPARVIERFSDKIAARQVMHAAGVPIVPGSLEALTTVEMARETAAAVGYPVMLKALAGGGGRGMRRADDEMELARVFAVAQAEARAAFGNGSLYLETLVARARHIEVQIVADRLGTIVDLGERECSIQRRHQKLLEEAPAIGLRPETRRELLEAAVRGARAAEYENVGTVEFLVDRDQRFYFLEVNTRIQVEHPVTEMVAGIDLVKEQIRLAAGEPISFDPTACQPRGHAVECRINAEDPWRDFAAAAGTVDSYVPPGGPGIRIDSHLYAGYQTPPYYDPLLAKVIAWGHDRTEAIARMRRALAEFCLDGLATTLPYQRALLEDPRFQEGDVSTDFVAQHVREALRDGASPSDGMEGSSHG
jgi:acetyl-CoA carboxylase biotin carboxylase subunit